MDLISLIPFVFISYFVQGSFNGFPSQAPIMFPPLGNGFPPYSPPSFGGPNYSPNMYNQGPGFFQKPFNFYHHIPSPWMQNFRRRSWLDYPNVNWNRNDFRLMRVDRAIDRFFRYKALHPRDFNEQQYAYRIMNPIISASYQIPYLPRRHFYRHCHCGAPWYPNGLRGKERFKMYAIWRRYYWKMQMRKLWLDEMRRIQSGCPRSPIHRPPPHPLWNKPPNYQPPIQQQMPMPNYPYNPVNYNNFQMPNPFAQQFPTFPNY